LWPFFIKKAAPQKKGAAVMIGAREMLHTTPLTLNKEYRRVYYRGRVFSTPIAVVYLLKNHKPVNRLGLTASKKTGCAVRRNRARRIMKEAYRLLEQQLPIGYDYVLVARARTAEIKTQEVMAVLEKAAAKLAGGK